MGLFDRGNHFLPLGFECRCRSFTIGWHGAAFACGLSLGTAACAATAAATAALWWIGEQDGDELRTISRIQVAQARERVTEAGKALDGDGCVGEIQSADRLTDDASRQTLDTFITNARTVGHIDGAKAVTGHDQVVNALIRDSAAAASNDHFQVR